MIDFYTNEPVQVRMDGGARPFLVVQPDQIFAVKDILDLYGYPYTEENDPARCQGEAGSVVLDLGDSADVGAIQELLDTAD